MLMFEQLLRAAAEIGLWSMSCQSTSTAVLRSHQNGIGGDQGVVAQVILIDPG